MRPLHRLLAEAGTIRLFEIHHLKVNHNHEELACIPLCHRTASLSAQRNRYHVTEHGIDDSMISILMLDAYILCNIRKNNAIMTRTSGPPASLAVTLVS